MSVSSPTTEKLSIFVRQTSHLNFFFTVILSLLLVESTVSVTSIYLTAYGINDANENKHINVGLQCLQLVCIILNWSTGKWVNTLFAGILSIQFVVYFVISIVETKNNSTTKSVTASQRGQIVLHNIVDKNSQGLFLSFLLIIESISIAYSRTFPSQPVVLAVSSYMLAFPEKVPIFTTVLIFITGFVLHLYMSTLFT